MVEARVWRRIEIRIGGSVVRGSWGHDGSMVQVRTLHGQKTTQIGGSGDTLDRLHSMVEEERDAVQSRPLNREGVPSTSDHPNHARGISKN